MGPGRPPVRRCTGDPAHRDHQADRDQQVPIGLKVADVCSALGITVEVVSADAMQQYRGMDIGTAKSATGTTGRATPPTRRPRRHGNHTVARYQRAAVADVTSSRAAAATGHRRRVDAVYQSLLDDWAFPATDPAVCARWEDRLAEVGTSALRRTRPARRRGSRSDPAHRRPPGGAGPWRSSD